MSYLNLISVGMGLVALGLPVIILIGVVLPARNVSAPAFDVDGDEIVVPAKEPILSRFSFHINLLSLAAMAVSILCQLHYNHYLVTIEDWSALLDTSEAVAKISTMLLVATMLLNVITITFNAINRRKGRAI